MPSFLFSTDPCIEQRSRSCDRSEDGTLDTLDGDDTVPVQMTAARMFKLALPVVYTVFLLTVVSFSAPRIATSLDLGSPAEERKLLLTESEVEALSSSESDRSDTGGLTGAGLAPDSELWLPNPIAAVLIREAAVVRQVTPTGIPSSRAPPA
jgi:hypothetical protein